MTQTYKVQVSMNQAHIVESGFVWKQGDFGFNIEIEVLDFDTTGATPQIIFRKSTGAVEATEISVAGNKFTYAIRGTELDTPGKVICDLKLKNSTTQRISTASVMFEVVADTLDGLAEESSSYSDTIAQIVEGFDDEIADITNRLNNQSTENNNLFWDRNLIQDKTYEKVVQSWGENTGWYYNYDATIIKDIKQSFDVTYKGFPTLKIGLSNAEGNSKWVGTKVGIVVGKTYYLQTALYNSEVLSGVNIHIGSQTAYAVSNLAAGWHIVTGTVTISQSETLDTVRITLLGNGVLYAAPISVYENSNGGLFLNDVINNIFDTSSITDNISGGADVEILGNTKTLAYQSDFSQEKTIRTAENNNMFWDRNLIQDKTYEKVVQSWGENTGWFYNYDATIVKDIKQTYDVTYKGFPTLQVKLSNATGSSKWVGTKTSIAPAKTYSLITAFYNESQIDGLNIHIGSKLAYVATNIASGWHDAIGTVTLASNESLNTVRVTLIGNGTVYVAPVCVSEQAEGALLLNDVINNMLDSSVNDNLSGGVDVKIFGSIKTVSKQSDLINEISIRKNENNNLFWDQNLIGDKTYESVVQSWDEDTGWFYNYDATIVKDIKQTYDVTYKGFPTLQVKLSNATGSSKWVGTKISNIAGKQFIIKGKFYSADNVPSVTIHLGSSVVWSSSGAVSAGWTEVSGQITISETETLNTFRFTVSNNATVYFAPFFVIEESLYNGLFIDDVLKSVIDYIGDVKENEIIMPSIFPCVKGMEADMYIDNLLNEKDFENIHNYKFDAKTECVQMKGYLAWFPVNNSGYANRLRISFSKNNLENYDLSKYFYHVTYAKSDNNGKSATCIFIGDSLTEYGGYISELINNFSDDAVTFSSLGTRTSTYTDSSGTSRTVNHEGRGGWTTKNYCEDASVGSVQNAFYNDGFDFEYYMNNNNFASPDFVFLMLGTNDLGALTIDQTVENLSTMINSIHSYNNNIVVFVGMPIPNYKFAYGDTKSRRNKRHSLYLKMQETWQYDFNTSNIILLPLFVNFDSVNDFGDFDNLSYLHPAKEQIVRDDTHPKATGYYKMANTIYAFIKYWLSAAE